MSGKIQMYFITGFLGAGKTTLLNRLLDLLADKKTGVIVNEFGQVGVDSALVPEADYDILELNNGQIFCSCMAGDFVKSVISYKDLPIEYLLVETSGLAHPKTLQPVLQAINDKAGDEIEYRGMICVVNSVEFPDLVDVLKPVEEQVLRSDVLIINKADLVDEEAVKEIETIVEDIHPNVKMYRTSYCHVDPEILGMEKINPAVAEEIPRRVTAAYSRPETYILKPGSSVSGKALEDFLSVIAPETYRMKGFVNVDGTRKYVDAVGTQVQLREPPEQEAGTSGKVEDGINIIVRTGKTIVKMVEDAWRSGVKTEYTIEVAEVPVPKG